MQKTSIFTFIVMFHFIVCGQATTTSNVVLPKQITQLKMNEQLTPARSTKNELQINLTAESYLQSSDLADSSEQAFQFQHRFHFKTGQNEAHTNLILGGYQNNKSIFGAMPEIFYQHTVAGKNSVQKTNSTEATQKYSIGRKILDVSQMDKHFNLGLTNSLYTQDFISYQSQGLVGFHQDISDLNWGVNISLLPIYLPNQGPGIKEINGKIQGSNRWVKKPPTQFAFNDANKEIIYSVDYSDISKLVWTPGALAQFRLGQLNNQIHWVTSVSKRPMNEPILERETFGDLNVVGQVNLVPNVIYDDLITSEIRYQNQQFRTAASFLADRPENKTARNFYSIQKLNPLSGYSFFVEYDLPTQKTKSVMLGMAAAEFMGGEITDINSDGTENIFTFTQQRLQYKKPMQFYIKADLFQVAGHTIGTHAKWLYDREQKGSVLNSEFNVQMLNSLNVRMGFDVIGTEDQKTEDYGFLQEFQANDRVYGGLDYVF